MHPEAFSAYSGFGVMFDKQFVYGAGGRPVVYQREEEYGLLPAELRWRHVRYEPPHIDFTWEREWRIPCESFPVNPATAVIVVPSEDWIDILHAEHEDHEEFQQRQYALLLGEDIAAQIPRALPMDSHGPANTVTSLVARRTNDVGRNGHQIGTTRRLSSAERRET